VVHLCSLEELSRAHVKTGENSIASEELETRIVFVYSLRSSPQAGRQSGLAGSGLQQKMAPGTMHIRRAAPRTDDPEAPGKDRPNSNHMGRLGMVTVETWKL
jgi:hypothetical protein